MAKGGPKLTEIDWNLVDELLHIQCTGEEIAGVIGTSYDTLERACKRDKSLRFADYSQEKRQGGKCSLRRAQWKLATEDRNATMLIWLGKQMLGQTDKQELTGRDGGPIEVKQITRKIVKPNNPNS